MTAQRPKRTRFADKDGIVVQTATNPLNIVHRWGKRGVKDGEFCTPTHVVVTADGDRVYVLDYGNHRIQCFRSDGTFLLQWGSWGMHDAQFMFLSGIAIDARIDVKASIQEAMQQVKQLAAFPPGILPLCIGYVGMERIYTCDNHKSRIQVFEWDGQFVTRWEYMERFRPSVCTVSIDGTVCIVDAENRSLHMFERDGSWIRSINTWRTSGHPGSISVTLSGLIYLIGGNTVTCCLSNGTRVQKWNYPFEAIAVLATDNEIYVSDTEGRILQFQNDGVLIQSWGGDADTIYGHLRFPNGMARGPNGLLYVALTEGDAVVVLRV